MTDTKKDDVSGKRQSRNASIGIFFIGLLIMFIGDVINGYDYETHTQIGFALYWAIAGIMSSIGFLVMLASVLFYIFNRFWAKDKERIRILEIEVDRIKNTYQIPKLKVFSTDELEKGPQ